MPIALIVGPAVALLGIVAVVFVMRHKSVEKHSMYSARRSQIEHKVRAARQRTLTPHGRTEKPGGAEAMPPPPPTFAPSAPPPTFNYEPSAYRPPPPAPPATAPFQGAAPESTPWEVGPAQPAEPAQPPPPPAPSYDYPPAEPAQPPPPPAPTYDFPPAEPAPTYPAAPLSTEQAWTPAGAPSEPLPPAAAEPVLTTTPAGAGASWSIVGDARDTTAEAERSDKKKSKKDKGEKTGSWQLASGEAPGDEADEEFKKPSTTMAIAQYAVLVVGLVMVLIGVLVMVANSHST